MITSENKLMASVAVFKELYANNIDIYDIIAEYIKSAVCFKKEWVFSSTKVYAWLKELYDFEIPEAVLKSTINNRLKRNHLVTFQEGVYVVNKSKFTVKNDLQTKFDLAAHNQLEIFNALLAFIECAEEKALSGPEKEDVIAFFRSFLLGNSISDKMQRLISSFILRNKNNNDFSEKLNKIQEGLVLYTGVRSTIDLNQISKWSSDLTVYLSTEQLFNASGFNGVVFKQLFDDFYSLVNEINQSSSGKERKRIYLKYFEETKKEIENFFSVAEQIIEGKAALDPSKIAMVEIIKGCSSTSEVVEKKARMFSSLIAKNIQEENWKDYYQNPEFNIEDLETIDKIHQQTENHNKNTTKDEIGFYLKLFTKINVLRNGQNNRELENIGFLFLTGNSFPLYLSNNKHVKNQETDFPFAVSIDLLTNRLWFKQKKGLGNKSFTPKSFDVITKAQIALSSQINREVSKNYQELLEKLKSGEMTKEIAETLNYNLRKGSKKPEEIQSENYEEYLEIFSERTFERYIREKNALEVKAEEGDLAKQQLKSQEKEMYLKDRNRIKSKACFVFWKELIKNLYFILIFLIVAILSINFKKADSNLSIFFGLVTLAGFIFQIWNVKSAYQNCLIQTRLNYRMNLIECQKSSNYIKRTKSKWY